MSKIDLGPIPSPERLDQKNFKSYEAWYEAQRKINLEGWAKQREEVEVRMGAFLNEIADICRRYGLSLRAVGYNPEIAVVPFTEDDMEKLLSADSASEL